MDLQVGGASSFPVVEQSQALMQLQSMCPGQIHFELAGTGSISPSGQHGDIAWCGPFLVKAYSFRTQQTMRM